MSSPCSRVIWLSGLYPQLFSVRRHISQLAGSGFCSIWSVTGGRRAAAKTQHYSKKQPYTASRQVSSRLNTTQSQQAGKIPSFSKKLISWKVPMRQLVIGMDSMEWDLVRRWASEGKLPTFQRLLDEGASGE